MRDIEIRQGAETKLREEYDNGTRLSERDYYNIINTAKKDGIRAGLQQGLEEGLQQGLEEGRQEGKAEVAGAMKRMGIPMETIMQATGLSREEIERI